MKVHKDIVTRVPVAPIRQTGELRNADVEILDAWLWPATALSESPAEARDDAVAIEVSLLPESRRLLREFPMPGLERPYLRHLEQRIARNPRDLLSHVRRIFVAYSLADAAAIAGALADLFVVLGRHGRPLRHRALRMVAGYLTDEQQRFFESHLDGGLDEGEPMPEIPQSRLSKRVTGTTRIVFRPGAMPPDADDPVWLARESLGKGRFDVAQAVLEGALESDPGNAAVSDELLKFYEQRDLRNRFRRTYTALLGRQLARRDRWDRLARKYRIRVGADV